jgi:hypothetical protein
MRRIGAQKAALEFTLRVSSVSSCCGAVIFVDESAEPIAASDLSVAGGRVRVCRVGRKPRESAVRARAIVVGGVAEEHCLEVAALYVQ